ncbi:MAG: hypothetical protein RLZZ412_930, partial [Verrucomicrobiota bacterium]
MPKSCALLLFAALCLTAKEDTPKLTYH